MFGSYAGLKVMPTTKLHSKDGWQRARNISGAYGVRYSRGCGIIFGFSLAEPENLKSDFS
jgi:hypothetical protein